MGGCVICVVIIFAYFVFQLHQGGLFSVTKQYGPRLQGFEDCKSIPTIAIGSEDSQVLSESPPLVLLSAADHLSLSQPIVSPGAIFLFNVDTKTTTQIPITGFRERFHPHGISIFRTATKTLVFVVNHRDADKSDQVVIFEYNSEHTLLNHVKTIEDDKFITINDVFATGEEQFYVTNNSGFGRRSVMTLISLFFPIFSRSSVVYWDGKQSYFAIPPGEIEMPNGVAVSFEKKQLYIANTQNPGALHIYSYDENNPQEPKLLKKVLLYTGIDNLDISKDGNIYAGCHPNFMRFLAHLPDVQGKSSPSQVIKINVDDLENIIIEEVLLDNGELISASSTALQIGKYLVVTPVFSDHIAVCE